MNQFLRIIWIWDFWNLLICHYVKWLITVNPHLSHCVSGVTYRVCVLVSLGLAEPAEEVQGRQPIVVQ